MRTEIGLLNDWSQWARLLSDHFCRNVGESLAVLSSLPVMQASPGERPESLDADEHPGAYGIDRPKHRSRFGVISPTLFANDGDNGIGHYDNHCTCVAIFKPEQHVFENMAINRMQSVEDSTQKESGRCQLCEMRDENLRSIGVAIFFPSLFSCGLLLPFS